MFKGCAAIYANFTKTFGILRNFSIFTWYKENAGTHE